MRIGVFGGTFNPVHFGHLRAAQEVREKLGLEKVLFVPSGNPPLKAKDLADPHIRLRMVDLAIAGNSAFEALDIECADRGKSYTVRTLEALLEIYRGAELVFILGTDAFLDLANWFEPDRLIALANFAVISRPGRDFGELDSSPYIKMSEFRPAKLGNGARCESARLRSGRRIFLVKITPLDISSTEIRNRLKKGLSIKYLLPEKVESFIISHRLYNKESKQNGNPGR